MTRLRAIAMMAALQWSLRIAVAAVFLVVLFELARGVIG